MIKNNQLINVHYDINDKASVKNYLEEAFTKRKAQKKKRFYKNLINLYEVYPLTITKIIDNIPKLGYWKDYIFILYYSDNAELTTYIYNLLLNQLLEDVQHDKDGMPTTTLAKWLPRQGSSFDRKFDFIDKFNSLLYPCLERDSARRRYRQLLSKLTSKLSVPEVKLCAKEYNTINFNDMGPISYTKNLKQFEKHCPNKLEEHHFKEYSKYKIWKFFSKISRKNIPEIETKAIERAWVTERDKFKKQLIFLNNFSNSKILIDFSQEMYTKFLHIILAVTTLLDTEIYINAKDPIKIQFESNYIMDRIDTVVNTMAYYRTIQYKKLLDDNSVTIVLTDRKEEAYASNLNSVVWWQLTEEMFCSNEQSYRGVPYIKRTAYYCNELVKNIIMNSTELTSSYHIYKIFFWFFAFIMVLIGINFLF
jgi:hypothetical protein